jgi:hypothetical protein
MKMLRVLSAAGIAGTLAATSAHAVEPTLRGSPSSMVRQHEVAKASDYSFLRDAAEVKRLADAGHLQRVKPTDDFRLANVSHPYARPEVVTFIERLSAQYRDACNERLVVTSLTRPVGNQPSNAHKLSVHPAGMAVDLRISQKAECRAWLEGTLLALESRSVLDVTRERTPPHYHIAVFPGAYSAYLERLDGGTTARAQFASAPKPRTASLEEEPASTRTPAPVKRPIAAARMVTTPADDDESGVLAVLTVCVLVSIAFAGRKRRVGRA